MILGDSWIRRRIVSRGLLKHGQNSMINPASVNLCLGNTFLIPQRKSDGVMLGDKVEYDRYEVQDWGTFMLRPREFCLATTREAIDMPRDVAAFVQGRSSIGRIGLTVQNAGFVDPGFHGHITLELVNESESKILLTPGYPLAQLVFFTCKGVQQGYAGKYNGQAEATGSRMEQDKCKYLGLGRTNHDQD